MRVSVVVSENHDIRQFETTFDNLLYSLLTETISCACCTRTVISLLLHPVAVLLSPIVLMLFAILEKFILLSISLLLCM